MKKEEKKQEVKKKPGEHPYIKFLNVRKKIVNESVSIGRRRQLKQQMIRLAKELIVARKRARGKFASEDNLKNRVLRQARQIMRSRMAGGNGKNYKHLNMAAKMAVDELIDAKKSNISSVASKISHFVERNEAIRLRRNKHVVE